MSRPARPTVARGPDAAERRDPRNPWAPTAFARLARAHAAGIAGDASFAIGLAGSVFFSLDFDSARWRVLLYLLLTIAPFAVAAPFIGPALDRIKGGRRWIIVFSMAARAVLAFLVVRHLDSLLFYPEAFGMLVMGKVYSISKSAVVPGTVRTDTELIEANSKLTVISAVVTVMAAAPAGALLGLGGAQWSVGFSCCMFLAATVFALRLTPTTVADEPADEAEKAELRSAGIFYAGSAMAVVRAVVGFLAFLLAFAFKNEGAPLWQLGVVAATAQIGFFLGAVSAPRLRRIAAEERLLVGTLVLTAIGGVGAALVGGILGSAVLSMLVGSTGSVAKQAFDAILQRDAPDANRGRSFARFETRFQLFWVSGAVIPIVVPIPAQIGFAVIALTTGATAVWYVVGQRRIGEGKVPVRRQGWKLRPLFGPGVRSDHPLTPDPPPEDDDATATDVDVGARPLRPSRAARPRLGADDSTLHEGVVADPTLVREEVRPEPVLPSAAGPVRARPEPPADPARRWMRAGGWKAPGPPDPTGATPGADDPTATQRADDVVGPDPREAGTASAGAETPSTPAARPSTSPGREAPRAAPEGQGLLFGPDAWEDLPRPPPSTTPADSGLVDVADDGGIAGAPGGGGAPDDATRSGVVTDDEPAG